MSSHHVTSDMFVRLMCLFMKPTATFHGYYIQSARCVCRTDLSLPGHPFGKARSLSQPHCRISIRSAHSPELHVHLTSSLAEREQSSTRPLNVTLSNHPPSAVSWDPANQSQGKHNPSSAPPCKTPHPTHSLLSCPFPLPYVLHLLPTLTLGHSTSSPPWGPKHAFLFTRCLPGPGTCLIGAFDPASRSYLYHTGREVCRACRSIYTSFLQRS